MNEDDVLVRDTDGKRFKARLLAHWSEIVADDGEIVSVKWIGANKYVAPRGPTFTLLETLKP